MSCDSTPSASSVAMMSVIAPAASSRASRTVLARASTPTVRTARSGATVTVPVPETQMPLWEAPSEAEATDMTVSSMALCAGVLTVALGDSSVVVVGAATAAAGALSPEDPSEAVEAAVVLFEESSDVADASTLLAVAVTTGAEAPSS